MTLKISTAGPFLGEEFFPNFQNIQPATPSNPPPTDSIESAAPTTYCDTMGLFLDIVCLPVRAIYVLFVWLSRCCSAESRPLPAEIIEAQNIIQHNKSSNTSESRALQSGMFLIAYYSARYPAKREEAPSYAQLLFPHVESFKQQEEAYDTALLQTTLSSLYNSLSQNTQLFFSNGDTAYKQNVIDHLMTTQNPFSNLKLEMLAVCLKMHLITTLYQQKDSPQGVDAFIACLCTPQKTTDADVSEEYLQTALQRVWSNASNEFKTAIITKYKGNDDSYLISRLEKLGVPS